MQLKLIKTWLSRHPSPKALWAALWGLCALLLVFTAEQQDLLGLPESLTAKREQLYRTHEYWRAWTTTLVHADLRHLAANSFFFTGLAYLLNGYFGFWVFPVMSFVAGGLINAITLGLYPEGITLVGASGVVYFMASFWLTQYFFIERGHSRKRRLINAAALSLVLLFPEAAEARVSYLAHAVGFGLGIPLGALYFAVRKQEIRAHEGWRVILPPPLEEPVESGPWDDYPLDPAG